MSENRKFSTAPLNHLTCVSTASRPSRRPGCPSAGAKGSSQRMSSAMSISHSPGLRSVSMWRCKSAEATVMRDLHFAPRLHSPRPHRPVLIGQYCRNRARQILYNLSAVDEDGRCPNRVKLGFQPSCRECQQCARNRTISTQSAGSRYPASLASSADQIHIDLKVGRLLVQFKGVYRAGLPLWSNSEIAGRQTNV